MEPRPLSGRADRYWHHRELHVQRCATDHRCLQHRLRSPGRVVLFHGTSSSGKTTVARAVQRLSDEPWVHLGIDTVWNAIDERWMEHGPRAAEGFLWSEDATIVPGPVGQRLARGMRAGLAAFARAGNDVLVDDVFIDPAWLVGWRKSSSTSSRCS